MRALSAGCLFESKKNIKMKIINIILTSQNGGAEQAFVDYTVVLKNLGHEVLVILKDDAPYSEELVKLGVKVEKIKNNFGFCDFFAVAKIKKITEEFSADTVMAHMGRSVVLARSAIKKIKNKKVFLVAVNHSMNVKRSIGADLIFSVNKEIFYRTVQFGQSEKNSFVIPNAIDLTDAIEVAPHVDLRDKKEIVLGCIGRLDKAKGFRYGIKTIKKLQEMPQFSDKKFILKIAGSGQRETFLRSLAKELGLEDKIQFLGWTKDKKSFFDSIDIFLMTSQRETFGLVVLEAMKYRKPIISVDADGPKEILRNEIDALMVNLEPLDDTQDRIAPAVARIINEPDLVNSMIENSFIRLKEKFSYQALKARMKECFGVAEKINL